ncbi:hypothetical protein JCM17960_17560 [Magnetospira thiophila]
MRIIQTLLALSCLSLAVPALAQQNVPDLTKEVPPEPPGLFHSTVLIARPGQPEMPKAPERPERSLPSFASQPQTVAPAALDENVHRYPTFGSMPQQPFWQGAPEQPVEPVATPAPKVEETEQKTVAKPQAQPGWRPAWPPQPYGGYPVPPYGYGYGYAPPYGYGR